jgi:hypothetical protein
LTVVSVLAVDGLLSSFAGFVAVDLLVFCISGKP